MFKRINSAEEDVRQLSPTMLHKLAHNDRAERVYMLDGKQKWKWRIHVLGLALLSLCYLLLTESVLASASEDTTDANQHYSALWLKPDPRHHATDTATVESGQFAALSMGTDIRMQVTGPILRASVRQRFQNASAYWAEGHYVFPLPETVAVDRFRLRVGDRVIEGQIQAKEAAKQQYERAKQRGQQASLLRQQQGHVFRTSVANIAPQDELTIEFEYQQRLDFKQHQFSLRLPIVNTPKYRPSSTSTAASLSAPDHPMRSPRDRPGNPVKISADIQAGFPITLPESESHTITARRHDASHVEINFDGTADQANRDFQLTWKIEPNDQPMVSILREQTDMADYGLLMVMPPNRDLTTLSELMARELILVLDVSGSMQGESIVQAKKAMIRAVDGLADQDQFNVIWFNDRAWSLFPQSMTATSQHRLAAIRHIGQLSANGGTQMFPAIELALRQGQTLRREERYLRQVIFMTDGAIDNEDQLFNVIERELKESRLFTVGIGAAPNAHFMRKAARAGRGTFSYVSDPGQVNETIDGLLETLSAPVLTHLSLDLGADDIDVLPSPLADVYLGEPLYAVFKSDAFPTQATLRAVLSGEPAYMKIPMSQARTQTGIRVEWAQKKIAQLMASHRRAQGDEKTEIEQDVLALALDHHQVTPFTSMVAVDVTPVRAGGYLRTENIPSNRPKGYENDKASQSMTASSARSLTFAQTATTWQRDLLHGCALALLALFLTRVQRRTTFGRPRHHSGEET